LVGHSPIWDGNRPPPPSFTNRHGCAIFYLLAAIFAAGLFFPEARRAGLVQVLVRDNNVDQALRALKKKLQREGVFREMKLRRNYEKPSERRAREKAEAVRRYRKLLRKRMEREGY
jgi:small subunit ribosomal protein S21